VLPPYVGVTLSSSVPLYVKHVSGQCCSRSRLPKYLEYRKKLDNDRKTTYKFYNGDMNQPYNQHQHDHPHASVRHLNQCVQPHLWFHDLEPWDILIGANRYTLDECPYDKYHNNEHELQHHQVEGYVVRNQITWMEKKHYQQHIL